MRTKSSWFHLWLRFGVLLTLGVSAARAQITITSQPTNQTVAVGGTVNLSVTAGGGGSLAYRWFKNGGQLVGATNSVLSVTNAGVTSGGSYYVAVTSTNGVAISRPALVQVGNSGLLAWGYNANGQLGNG